MGTPDDIDVWIGLDIGKAEHFADARDAAGESLFAGAVANDEADIETLLGRAQALGAPALVVDQPGSLASLVLAVAARLGVPVAYVPGLIMRRAADLYPGEAKTDRRDAFVLADTGRIRRHQVHWLDAGNDELLAQLRVLNGYDADLATDATRLSNRLRDALTGISPALDAFWARGCTIRASGISWHATRLPRHWRRPAAAASRARSGSAPRLAKALTVAVAGARSSERRRAGRGRDGARDLRGRCRTRPHAGATEAARGRHRGALRGTPFRTHPRHAPGHRPPGRVEDPR